MVRSLVAVLALTAAAARAQGNPEIARSPGAAAPRGEDKGKVVLASRSPSPRRDGGTGAPDGGVEGHPAVRAIEDSTAAQVADCFVSETLLSGQALAVRYYAAPARPTKGRYKEWGQAPYVQSVVRCDQRFYLQVYSQSADSWIMDHAKAEGSQGEALNVALPKFRRHVDGWSINLIAVEASPGVNFSMLRLHMVGKDGRVAHTTVEDLP